MAAILPELFRHNHWANLRLLDACVHLTDAQLDSTVHGTQGSIRATLTHIVGAEERYVGIFTGVPPAVSREREPWLGITELRAIVDKSGQALVDLAEREEPGRILRGMRGGQPYELPAWLVLTQAINHATEHRSHVCTILTQQGVEPPPIDGWSYHAQMGATPSP